MQNNPLPTPDHDLLITLHTKMDGLTVRVDELGEGLRDKINKVEIRIDGAEARLNTIDLYHTKIPIDEMIESFNWVQRVRANFMLLGIFGTVLLTIIVYAINNLLNKWLKF